MPGWLEDIFASLIVYIAIPAIFIVSAILPFLAIRKVFKRRLTLASGTFATLIAIGLIALDLYGLYWLFGYLQGRAACSLYGC